MKKSLVLSLALLVVLFASLGMAPAAPRIDTAKPQAFNANLQVFPIGDTVNVPHGNSDRWRTINEHYVGGIFGDINGAVLMSITTNFVETGLVGPFSGPFHATIDINDANGNGTMSVNITGKIDGVKADFGPPYGIAIAYATISGQFNSTGATGSLAGKHINGTLGYTIDYTFTTYPYPINGGTLKGTIN